MPHNSPRVPGGVPDIPGPGAYPSTRTSTERATGEGPTLAWPRARCRSVPTTCHRPDLSATDADADRAGSNGRRATVFDGGRPSASVKRAIPKIRDPVISRRFRLGPVALSPWATGPSMASARRRSDSHRRAKEASTSLRSTRSSLALQWVARPGQLCDGDGPRRAQRWCVATQLATLHDAPEAGELPVHDRGASRKGDMPGPGNYKPVVAIGPQVRSDRSTAAQWGFGTCERHNPQLQPKKTQYIGREYEKGLYGVNSPGRRNTACRTQPTASRLSLPMASRRSRAFDVCIRTNMISMTIIRAARGCGAARGRKQTEAYRPTGQWPRRVVSSCPLSVVYIWSVRASRLE